MSTAGEPRVPEKSSVSADWPAKVADSIESSVAVFHDRLIRPIMVVARAVAFSFVIVSMTLVLGTAASIGLIRLLDVYVFPGRVWASYALVSALFLAVGSWAWSLRRPRNAEGS
jgi:hypothetical protein